MDADGMTNALLGTLSKIHPGTAQKIKQNPQIVEQAKRAFRNYSPTKSGFMQAVSEFGGMDMLTKAQQTLDKYPMAKFALRGFGVDIERIKSDLYGAPISSGGSRANSANSFQSRLDRLK